MAGKVDPKKLPESDTPLGYINERINAHIEEYKSKRDKSRRSVLGTRISTAVLAAITTIVLGLGASNAFVGTEFSTWAPMVALVSSALTSLTSSWETLRGHEWKWVTYRSTLFALYNLRDDIGFSIAGNRTPSKPQVAGYFDRLKRILENVNDEWKLRSFKDEKKDDQQSKSGNGSVTQKAAQPVS